MTRLINIIRTMSVLTQRSLNVLRRFINLETSFGYMITTYYWYQGKWFPAVVML